MANRPEHVQVGALAGGVVGLLQVLVRGGTFGECLAGGVGGALSGAAGGRLPDIIEPAVHPNHRGPAHSVAFAAASTTALVKVQPTWTDLWARQRPATLAQRLSFAFLEGAGAGFGPGYLSHLLLDAQTPKSLPLLGVR